MKSTTSILIALSSVAAALSASAAAPPTVSQPTTPRIVVKYRTGSNAKVASASGQATTQVAAPNVAAARERAIALTLHTTTVHGVRVLHNGAVVYDLGHEMTIDQARQAASAIARDSQVESAEPDVRVHAHAVSPPNDTYADMQWPLMPRSAALLSQSAAGGSDFFSAWKVTQGAGVIVGVIDTGIQASPDLTTQILPGYDFISADSPGNYTTAGDGDGRDPDPTDPGDACSTDAKPASSWHGLAVTGLIAATANNGYGIAGAAPAVKIVPMRALGVCGGFMSDISDAIVWAAGQPVAGVPANANPVQVINLSLGASASSGTCPAFFQQAIDKATAANIPVVASAGNDSGNALGSPANCAGVIVAAAHTKSGDLAVYSNHAPGVTLTAPGGGDCVAQTGTSCANDPTVTVGNTGTTTPGVPWPMSSFEGTSAAAPHVTATIAMMRAVSSTLTIAQIKGLLTATAAPFVAGSACATSLYSGTCGAGMLDAGRAVAAAQGLVVTITPSYSTPTVAGGASVSLKAAVSAGMGSSYHWSQIGGAPVTLSGADTDTVNFTAPANHGTLIFNVDAVTSLGNTVSTQLTVTVANPPQLAKTAFAVSQSQPLSVQLEGSDIDSSTVTYQISNQPVGMSLTTDGLLKYASSTAGSVTADIAMTDSLGTTSSQTITVTVTAQAASSGGGGTQGGGGAPASSGGGGSADGWFLAIAALGLLLTPRRH